MKYKQPLSAMAIAQMKAMGMNEQEYRQHKSDASKKASRDNAYFRKLRDEDPDKFMEISRKNSKK